MPTLPICFECRHCVTCSDCGGVHCQAPSAVDVVDLVTGEPVQCWELRFADDDDLCGPDGAWYEPQDANSPSKVVPFAHLER